MVVENIMFMVLGCCSKQGKTQQPHAPKRDKTKRTAQPLCTGARTMAIVSYARIIAWRHKRIKNTHSASKHSAKNLHFIILSIIMESDRDRACFTKDGWMHWSVLYKSC